MPETCRDRPTPARSFHGRRKMRTGHPLPRGFPGAESRPGMRSQAPPRLWFLPEAREGYTPDAPKYEMCLQLPAFSGRLDSSVNALFRIRAAGPKGLCAPLSKWGSFSDEKAHTNEKGDPEDSSESTKTPENGRLGRGTRCQGRSAPGRRNVCAAHQQIHGNPGDFTLRRET